MGEKKRLQVMSVAFVLLLFVSIGQGNANEWARSTYLTHCPAQAEGVHVVIDGEYSLVEWSMYPPDTFSSVVSWYDPQFELTYIYFYNGTVEVGEAVSIKWKVDGC